MIKRSLFSIFVFVSFLMLPILVFGACPISGENNFSAQLEYKGQDSSIVGSFTDLSNDVPTGNFFQTKLSLMTGGSVASGASEEVNVVLVMDRSGSMNSSSKLSTAKEALLDVVGIFKDINNPENKLALYSYNSSVSKDQGLTNNYSVFEGTNGVINKLKATGSTNIGGALSSANGHLKSVGDENKRWFIILASDGLHNTGTNPKSVKVDSRITVYTIGIGSDADKSLLKWIATQGTGKGAYYFTDADQLVETLKGIMEIVLYPFRSSNIKLDLNLENFSNGFFSAETTTPVFSSFDPNAMSWDNLGEMKTGDNKDFMLTFKNKEAYSQNPIPINKDFINLSYIINNESEGAQICNEKVPINIVSINNVSRCTGVIPPVPNSEICFGDNNPPKSTQARLVENCTSGELCEYQCSSGYVYDEGSCRRAECVGVAPSNAVTCGNDEPTIDINKTLVQNCGSAYCSYECDEANGYNYLEGVCRPVIDGRCGNVESFNCGNIPGNLCLSGFATTPQYNKATERWTWVCKGQYLGSDSTSCFAKDFCGGNYYEVNP